MKRLVIIEDQTAIREMLVEILRLDNNYQLVGESGDGQDALRCAWTSSPTSRARRQATRPERRRYSPPVREETPARSASWCFPATRTPCLSAKCSRRAPTVSWKRPPGSSNSRKGLETVANGGTYFGPAVAALLRNVVANPAASSAADFLTDREREILQLVAESHSTKEIAAKLGISIKTVDNHRTNLMRKLNLHDVASLTRYALEIGLIEPRKHFSKTLPNPATSPRG
jgi:DNA-binding NarL/FixJ family response regulator